MKKKILERPSERQKKFLTATTKYVAYGGARGGGKSWAVRYKAKLLALKNAGIRLLIMRKSYPELRENHILPLLKDLHEIAKFRETDKVFIFPNGSRIKFGYCEHDTDVNQYQGQEYDVIFMDEATHFTHFQFMALSVCVRGANSFPKRFYLTCNPGGIGHSWVKRLFIDKLYEEGEEPREYSFVAATVFDNKALMQCDPGYLKRLQALPTDIKKAWLYGDWDIFKGQYFSEFNRNVHVIKPFEIPAEWRRYFVMDYGLDMLAAYWLAVDFEGKAYVYKELYEKNLIVSQAIEKIKAYTCEPIYSFLAPKDLWNRGSDTGKSTAELFYEGGIFLEKASSERVQGWYNLKEWLRPFPNEKGEQVAQLRFFESCQNIIRTLPCLIFDEKNPNDCSREPHELTHAPDAIRYFVAARPTAAQKKEKQSYAFENFNLKERKTTERGSVINVI